MTEGPGRPTTRCPVKLPAVALGGPVVITGLLPLPPIIMLVVVGLQLGAVIVLAWAELARQRQSLAGALQLVEAMGGVAVIRVGKNGELHVEPVQDEAGSNQR
jgi:hypothetical protein